MNKTLVIPAITLIAIIMVVGSVSPAMATKDDNNGKAMGCEKANDNSQAREQNPHCTNPCDPNGNGAIDVRELATYMISQGFEPAAAESWATFLIYISETLDREHSDNGLIDNPEELVNLNRLLPDQRIPACTAF